MGICCMAQGTQTGALGNNLQGEAEGDMGVSMADSCLTENNKIL